ncbi:hypothetical protein JCM19047_2885 [Bacillus sp. JCM 19047]|nr:hypothetical protein JCM19047_2885 [Bacillus sp. JCM 19047]
MKGLLLNQYYSVQKSIWVYALLAFVIPVVILIFFEGGMLDRLAAFVAIGFMVSPALEVLKHEGSQVGVNICYTSNKSRQSCSKSLFILCSITSSWCWSCWRRLFHRNSII